MEKSIKFLIKNIFILLIFVTGYLLLATSHKIYAATLYWVGANGTNASIASNWSTTNPTSCVANVTPSASAPASADTINFDADCDNSAVLDSSFTSTVTSVVLNSGYAGTVTLSNSLIVSGVFTASGGTWDSTNQSLSIGGTFTLNNAAATFIASSGTTTFTAAFSITAGIFTPNNGTVSFSGGSTSVTISCNSASFFAVNFTGQTSSKSISSNCSLPLGASPTIPRSIILSGTLSGSGTLTQSTSGANFQLNSGASLVGFTGLNVRNFTLNGAAIDLSTYTDVSINEILTFLSGSLTAPLGTMYIGSFVTFLGGTFNHNNGTVVFNGTNQSILGNMNFYNFTKISDTTDTFGFNGGSHTTVAGTFTLQGSNNNLLTVQGGGFQWGIDAQGPRVLSNLIVRDSKNNNSTLMSGDTIYDAGNNSGWIFSGSTINLFLDKPGDSNYISEQHPTFKWKRATSITGKTITGYSLRIDNGDTGSWQINDIPVTGSGDVNTSKYTIHYDGFTDNDPNNDYISVYTHASSFWNSTENNGALREGSRRWYVTATDNTGNSVTQTRSLLVDTTKPSVLITQIDQRKVSSTSNPLVIYNTLPTLYGVVRDDVYGEGSKEETIASGPVSFIITFRKLKLGNTFIPYIDSAILLNEITVSNTKSKYSGFSFTPSKVLQSGTYKVGVVGIDGAGNKSISSNITLMVIPSVLPRSDSNTNIHSEKTLQSMFPYLKNELAWNQKYNYFLFYK